MVFFYYVLVVTLAYVIYYAVIIVKDLYGKKGGGKDKKEEIIVDNDNDDDDTTPRLVVERADGTFGYADEVVDEDNVPDPDFDEDDEDVVSGDGGSDDGDGVVAESSDGAGESPVSGGDDDNDLYADCLSAKQEFERCEAEAQESYFGPEINIAFGGLTVQSASKEYAIAMKPVEQEGGVS